MSAGIELSLVELAGKFKIKKNRQEFVMSIEFAKCRVSEVELAG